MQHDPLERDEALTRRLKGLPEERQPYGFAEFQRRARQPAVYRPRFAQRWLLATAAVAAAAFAGFGLHWRDGGGGLRGPADLSVQVPVGPKSGQTPQAGQAAVLEGWLASLPPEPAMARVGARAAVASLEDRIALLDDVMSAERAARAPQARLAAIEEQRSQVLRSLVQVRYAEGLATEPY